MKLWLDDARRAPSDDWVHVLTSKACIAELETFEVKHLALDHDLGIIDLNEYSTTTDEAEAELWEDTGYRVVLWMEEHGVWPEQISLHSENPAGVKRMRLGIMASGLYKAGPSGRHFARKVQEPEPEAE